MKNTAKLLNRQNHESIDRCKLYYAIYSIFTGCHFPRRPWCRIVENLEKVFLGILYSMICLKQTNVFYQYLTIQQQKWYQKNIPCLTQQWITQKQIQLEISMTQWLLKQI